MFMISGRSQGSTEYFFVTADIRSEQLEFLTHVLIRLKS